MSESETKSQHNKNSAEPIIDGVGSKTVESEMIESEEVDYEMVDSEVVKSDVNQQSQGTENNDTDTSTNKVEKGRPKGRPSGIRHKDIMPMHYYDDEGRVKPPVFVNWIIAYLMRGFILIIIASSLGSDTNAILGVFYPNHSLLYAHLVISIPAFVAFYLVSNRKKLLDDGKNNLLKLLKPTLLLGLALDFVLHIYIAQVQHWQYSTAAALGMLLPIVFSYIIWRNKRV